MQLQKCYVLLLCLILDLISKKKIFFSFTEHSVLLLLKKKKGICMDERLRDIMA